MMKDSSKTRKKKIDTSELPFNIVNSAVMVILCILMLYPMLYILGRSFMGEAERAFRPFAFIPHTIDMGGYRYVFNRNSIVPHAFFVSVARTVIGTLANLFFTSLFAYVLSRKKYPLKTPLTMYVVFTMWLNGGMIANYVLIKELGLLNKFAVYILPGLIGVWNLILLRNFFAEIPEEMEESAVIDGASEPTMLFRIYLPLSSAAIATVGLFYAVGHWNSWFDAVMYVSKREVWTMQMVLREVVNNAYVDSMINATEAVDNSIPKEQIQFATIVVAVFPILVTYPFLQKYFVKGVMVGSLKG